MADLPSSASEPLPHAPKPPRQRQAVSRSMAENPDFRSAQEIYAQLRRDGNPIGLATVYRALQALVDSGEVDLLRGEQDGEARYRRCGPRHHHHLVCRLCGRTIEIDSPVLERWSRAIGSEHGFADVEHDVNLYGSCGDCAQAAG